MVVDTSPVIDIETRKIAVSHNIDINEEVAISLNGLLAIFEDDIESISNNVITVVEGLDIDWDNDEIAVMFTAI
jgi:hypothetical protein